MLKKTYSHTNTVALVAKSSLLAVCECIPILINRVFSMLLLVMSF